MDRFQRELSALLTLAFPAIVTQLGNMAMQVVDLFFVSRLGTAEMNAVGIGATIVIGTLILGQGLVMGMDPFVSQAHGAGRGQDTAKTLQSGCVIALLVTPPVALIWWFAEPMLLLMEQDPATARMAAEFCRGQIPGIAPFYLFTALRSYLQGRNHVSAPMWVMLAANLVNAAAGILLIFGAAGFPSWGVFGAGMATSISRIFLFTALVAWVRVRHLHRDAWVPLSFTHAKWKALRPIIRMGIPILLHLAFEIWAFAGMAIVVGWLGGNNLAAHTVAMRFAALTFMVPLGLSFATSIRVGNLIGAGNRPQAQFSAWCSMLLSTAFMTLSGLAMIIWQQDWPRLFFPGEDGEANIALAASIFPLAAAFQIFDGIQVVACGVLRGMGTPRPAAVINLVGYYFICIPLGVYLALPELPLGLGAGQGLGLTGIWWGFFAGLGICATFFLYWIARYGPGRER